MHTDADVGIAAVNSTASHIKQIFFNRFFFALLRPELFSPKKLLQPPSEQVSSDYKGQRLFFFRVKKNYTKRNNEKEEAELSVFTFRVI